MQRADDTSGHGAAVQRSRHRDDHLPLDKRRRFRERKGGQAADLVDLDHRHAGLAVVVDQARLVRFRIAQQEHGQRPRVGDDLHIGDDVAVAGGEVARPGADRRLQLRHHTHDRGLGPGRGLDDGRVLGDGDARPEVHRLRVGARLQLEHGEADAARDDGRQQRNCRDQGDRPQSAGARREPVRLDRAGVRRARLVRDPSLWLHPPSLGFGRNRL